MKPYTILRTTLKVRQRYQNWREIMLSIAKKRYPTQVILKNGTRFEAAEVFSWLVDEIFFEKIYTPTQFLRIDHNDVIVDIGAHIGVFTIFSAINTKKIVYAFEPSPANFEDLKHNIAVNNLKNVLPQRIAVSDTVGSAAFNVSPQRSTGHMLQNTHSLSTDFEKAIEVPTTTLQDIMDRNNITEIGFLKMDCEGVEGAILLSTPENYLRKVRKIAIEFHDHLSKIKHDEIRARLEETGFTTDLKMNDSLSFGYLYGWRDSLMATKEKEKGTDL